MRKLISQIIQKEFLLSGTAQMTSVIAMFIQTKLIAMYFTKAEYGSWSMLMTYYMMLNMLPFTALNNALCRYAADYKESKNEYASSILMGYTFIFAIQILAFGGICFLGIIKFDFENYWCFFMAYCYAETIKSAFFNICIYFRDRKKVLFSYLFELLFVVLIAGGMYVTNVMTIRNMLAVICIKDLMLVLLLNKGFKFRFQGNICCVIYKKMVYYSLPIIFWNVFGYMQGVVNKWYLNDNLSVESVATYTVAVSAASYIPTFYQSFISTYFFPIIYARKEKMSINKYIQYICCFAAPLFAYCIIMIFFGKYVVIIAYDVKYLDITEYLKYTCFAASVSILADLSIFEILRMGLTRKLVIPKIVPGALMLFIGYYLIPGMGFDGAVLNYCIGQVSYAVLCFIICIYVQFKEPIKGERI